MDSQGVRGLGGAVNFFAPIGVKLRAIFLINLDWKPFLHTTAVQAVGSLSTFAVIMFAQAPAASSSS